MNAFHKQAVAAILSLAVVGLTSFSFPIGASASHEDSDPKIKEITERDRTSVTLPIKYEKREGDRVTVRVNVENLKTGEKFTRNIKTRLNDDEGRKKIVIDGLEPGTEYKFKIKIRKSGGGDYSDSSDSRRAWTAN